MQGFPHQINNKCRLRKETLYSRDHYVRGVGRCCCNGKSLQSQMCKCCETRPNCLLWGGMGKARRQWAQRRGLAEGMEMMGQEIRGCLIPGLGSSQEGLPGPLPKSGSRFGVLGEGEKLTLGLVNTHLLQLTGGVEQSS